MIKTRIDINQFIKDYNDNMNLNELCIKHDITYQHADNIKNRLIKQGLLKPQMSKCVQCGEPIQLKNMKHKYCKKCRQENIDSYYERTYLIRDMRIKINGLRLMDPIAAQELLDEIERIEGPEFRRLVEGKKDKEGWIEIK